MTKTPETTADQAKAAADSSPTLQDPPAKGTSTKKPTAAEVRAELSDLKESAAASRQKLTQHEITFQKARNLLRSEGTPGMTMQQDHYRLAQMVAELRKLFKVEPEEVSGGQ